MTSPLRLGLVTDRRVVVAGRSVAAEASLGRLIDALRHEFAELKVAASPSPDGPLLTHRTGLDSRDFWPLPHAPSFATAFPRSWSYWRTVRALERVTDALLLLLPLPTPLALPFATRPRVYNLCADPLEAARRTPNYSGWKRAAALAGGAFIHAVQRRAVSRRDTGVVANGEALWARYRPRVGSVVVSSAVYEREIASCTRRRSRDAPFRVLFVGALRPGKGVDTLLDAYELLLESVPDAELQFVGAEPQVDRGVETELRRRIGELSERSAIQFVGSRRFGPELFQCYADADVLAAPSHSEGTPRVLVEARAFGCAVVAANVGGVPTSVEHGVDGLLVPPGDPRALHDALRRLADDKSYREVLSRNGLQRAPDRTLERFVDAIVTQVERVAGIPARTR